MTNLLSPSLDRDPGFDQPLDPFAPPSEGWTDAAFMALPDDGGRYELVDGELKIMGNSGMEQGNIAGFLCGMIELWARQSKLGITCDSSTAFTMASGNRRSADVSFVSRGRLTGLKRPLQGYFQGSPDLVVEVLSPSNTFEEIHTKLVEYFDNGTQLAWVINPAERSVLIYRSPEPAHLCTFNDALIGEEILPGFELAVAELFPELDF